MTTDTVSEDDNFGTEQSQKVICLFFYEKVIFILVKRILNLKLYSLNLNHFTLFLNRPSWTSWVPKDVIGFWPDCTWVDLMLL